MERQTCANCVWWQRFPVRDILAEWEADTRPYPKGIWQWLKWSWDPSLWKDPPPDVRSLEFLIQNDPNPTRGWCHFDPRQVITNERHVCGHHEWRDAPPQKKEQSHVVS